MNWEKYWNNNANNHTDDSIKQVQRKDIESTLLTVTHIAEVLNIKKEDKVLDVCCGNGILTQQIAATCKSIVGVDHSESLLEAANSAYKSDNSTFLKGSALDLSSVLESHSFDKIYLQFSFQYFDKKGEGEKVILELLKCLKPNGMIFLGDIPDHSKRMTFYNTPMKKLRLIKHKLEGKNGMGKFWKQSEFDAICEKLQVKGEYLVQASELPYAHYRFDYLIEN